MNGISHHFAYSRIRHTATAISTIQPLLHLLHYSPVVIISRYGITKFFRFIVHTLQFITQFILFLLRKRVGKTKSSKDGLILLKPMRKFLTPNIHMFLFIQVLYGIMRAIFFYFFYHIGVYYLEI